MTTLSDGTAPRFRPGARVRVRDLALPGHVRTPLYIRHKEGVVVRQCGARLNPELLAYGQDGTPRRDLYVLRFRHADLWPGYANGRDTLHIEIYDHWLEPA